ncbi:hypothetical protein RclHR1_01870003 [Rhizophagus clarus]|nr:hypothetical protein RclHR1_01870003 [Rhizophagus clarus]
MKKRKKKNNKEIDNKKSINSVNYIIIILRYVIPIKVQTKLDHLIPLYDMRSLIDLHIRSTCTIHYTTLYDLSCQHIQIKFYSNLIMSFYNFLF